MCKTGRADYTSINENMGTVIAEIDNSEESFENLKKQNELAK